MTRAQREPHRTPRARPHTPWILWLVLAAGATIAPTPAGAGEANPMSQLRGTIVYIRGGNIWAARAATGQRVQITRDGGYRSPSMADDGTVGAVQQMGGRSHFVTITRSGRKRAFPPGELVNLISAELSPDGGLFAFVYVVVSPLRSNPARVGLTFADRWGADAIAGVAGRWDTFSSSYYHVRWMTNERLVLSGNGAYPYLVRGPRTGWEYDSPYMVRVPALRDEIYDVARNGNRMLVLGATYRVVNIEERITGWHAIAYRPAAAGERVEVGFSLEEMRACAYASAPGRCVPVFVPEVGFQLQGEPKGGALSPDGRAFTFADGRGVLVTEPIHSSMRAYVLDPQGSEPEWSPFQW